MSATPAGPKPAPDLEAKLREYTARFTSAINQKDADAVVKSYAPDAVVMPPHMPAAQGTKAIRDLFQSMLDAGVSDLAIETSKIEQAGDLVVRSGRYTLRVPRQGGGKGEDRGKYLDAWRRQPNGEYLITADIWNSDLPPSE